MLRIKIGIIPDIKGESPESMFDPKCFENLQLPYGSNQSKHPKPQMLIILVKSRLNLNFVKASPCFIRKQVSRSSRNFKLGVLESTPKASQADSLNGISVKLDFCSLC